MQIAALVLLAIGLIFGCLGYWLYRKVQNMKTWPSVDGTILHSGVENRVSTDQDGTESVSFTPVVEYQYTVGANKHTGTRIGLSERGYGTRRAAEQRLGIYQPGAGVRVKYNPAEPGSAVLEESGAGLAWVFSGTGAAMIVAGILMLASPSA
jgi:hypothetical protein